MLAFRALVRVVSQASSSDTKQSIQLLEVWVRAQRVSNIMPIQVCAPNKVKTLQVLTLTGKSTLTCLPAIAAEKGREVGPAGVGPAPGRGADAA